MKRISLPILFTILMLVVATLAVPRPSAACTGCSKLVTSTCWDESEAYYQNCIDDLGEVMGSYCYDRANEQYAGCLIQHGCMQAPWYP